MSVENIAPIDATQLIHLFSRFVKIEYGGSGGVSAQSIVPVTFSSIDWTPSASFLGASTTSRGVDGAEVIVPMVSSEPTVDAPAVVRILNRRNGERRRSDIVTGGNTVGVVLGVD